MRTLDLRETEIAKRHYTAARLSGRSDKESLQAAGVTELDAAIVGCEPGSAIAAMRGAYGRRLQFMRRRSKAQHPPVLPAPVKPDLGQSTLPTKPVQPIQQPFPALVTFTKPEPPDPSFSLRYREQCETGFIPGDETMRRMTGCSDTDIAVIRRDMEAEGWTFQTIVSSTGIRGWVATKPIPAMIDELRNVNQTLAQLSRHVQELEARYARR